MELTKLLSYTNPKIEAYNRIISETKCRDHTCDGLISTRARGFKKRWGEFLREKLSGEILVDLGCGTDLFDWTGMAGLAKEFGARAYIGVDKFFSSVEDILADLATAEMKKAYAPMEIFLVGGDMLRFSASLQTNSANFTINNIDFVIIPSERYFLALAEELKRATKGIIFGNCADPLSYLHYYAKSFNEVDRYDTLSHSGLLVKSSKYRKALSRIKTDEDFL